MRKIILVTGCFLLLCVEIAAQVPKERVRFAHGKSAATLKGTVRGYGARDYIIHASAGQTLDVKVRGTNQLTVFTVLMPNGHNLEGAAEMDEFNGELPATGDYVVRVDMIRAAARRKGAITRYTLKISIT